MSKLTIISGGEATGKSTIRNELARRLKISYLSKDIIKEKMFDEESVSTWNFSWYEDRAKSQLFKDIKEQLESNQSFIIEANFKSADTAKLKNLLSKDTQVYEIFCHSRGFTAFKRFVRRNESGARHRGHHDRRWYAAVFIYDICGALHIKWPYKPMQFSDRILYLDTTDLAKIDYEAIIKFISQPA
jgi:predicted kinase